ncbi:MAG: tetratricopeptide repeat protein, partial [Deltaproteobacteria bacterium]|nr:tetratricopeptide repeat protein [Deltaproteobacteria bacterium]
LPGGGGAVPLPGGGGPVPLPGGGAMPFPAPGGGLPFGAAPPFPGAAAPLPFPAPGGGAPLPGFGPPGGAPAPRSFGASQPDAAGPVDNSVVAPFHGEATHARAAPPPPRGAAPLDAGVLDFIDRAAADGSATRKSIPVRIRKRSGKVVGPFDEATVLRMLRSHELMGSEDASEDAVTWRPLSQFPGFAQEIQALMASALSGLGDLPAPAGGGAGFADLPAPVGAPGGRPSMGGLADLPAPFAGSAGRSDLPAPLPAGGRSASGFAFPPPPGGPGDDPFANLDADLPTPAQRPAGVLPAVPDLAAAATAAAAGQPAAKAAKARPAGKERSVPLKLLLGVGGALAVLATALVTEFVFTDVGAFGRKKIAALINPPPPPKVVEPPKPKVHIPVWENASLEALLAEDNLASYQEAQKKLQAQLDSGASEAAITLARAYALPAYLDSMGSMADQAAPLLARATDAGPRPLAALRGLLALARGKPGDAVDLLTPVAGGVKPEVKDLSDADRATEALVQRVLGLALLGAGKHAEAMQRFDASLTAEPSSVVSSLGQARALLAAGDAETAQGYLERGMALQPDNIRVRLELGALLLKRGKGRQAREVVQHVAGSAGAKGSALQRAAAHVLLSDVAVLDKDFQVASNELKAAVAETPDDMKLKARSGDMLLRMREWAQAGQLFNEMLAADPAFVPSIIGSARAKIGATDALGGYKQLEEAVAKNPQSADLTYWFGFAAESLSKIPDAIKLYKKAETLDPRRAAPVAAQARFVIAERKYPVALSMLQASRARVAPEEEPVLRAMLAQVAYKQKNYPLAFSEFEEALKAMPQNTEARAAYGAALRDQGRTEEAQKQLKQALVEDPRNAIILAENGSFAASQGQYERAIDFFQQAIAVAPKDADFHVRLGAAMFQKGDAAGALEALKVAQGLAPTNPDVFFWMALAIRKTDPDRAKTLLKQGMELAPDEGRFDHELGRSVAAEGANLEAIDYMRGAVRKDPKNGDAYFEMGKLYMEQARYADALDQLRRASEVMPAKGFVHMYMGDCQFKSGQYDQARREYETAIRKDGSLSEAYCKLGDVTRTDGKLKPAVGFYEKCVQLNPKHKEAWKWYGHTLNGLGGKPNQRKALDAWRTHLRIHPDDPDNEDLRDQMADLHGN